jgi:hypothetical protein
VPDPWTAGLVRLDVAEGLVEGLARCVALAAGEVGGRLEDAAAVGLAEWSAGEVAGLNVATDSIAPATRHSARMLASSGMTLPRAAKGANGPASRRSRFRRRNARSSRW